VRCSCCVFHECCKISVCGADQSEVCPYHRKQKRAQVPTISKNILRGGKREGEGGGGERGEGRGGEKEGGLQGKI
jgi:hypothetical protein